MRAYFDKMANAAYLIRVERPAMIMLAIFGRASLACLMI